MDLAPWYSYQITNAQIAALPAQAVQFIEAYDNDEVNDHRMAIDLYNTSHATAPFPAPSMRLPIGCSTATPPRARH